MTQLSVELTDEQSEFVAASVACGDYPDSDTVLRDAVDRLQLENATKLMNLKAMIQAGYDSGFSEEDAFQSVAKEMGWELDD